MKKISLFLILWVLFGCAKKDPEIVALDDLALSVQVTRISSTEVNCNVIFYRKDQPGVTYWLEEDSIVTCDGLFAWPWGSGYSRNFYHPDSDPIRVGIIRPKAGSTVVHFYNLQ